MTTTEIPARSARRAAPPARRTHVPASAGHPGAPEVQRNLSRTRREDVLRIVGAAAASIASSAWLFTQLLPAQGALAFVLVTYVLFVAYFVVLISFDDDRVTVLDRVVGVLIHSAAVVLLLALAVVVVFTLARGSQAFRHANFWTQDLSMAGPLDPMTVGGMAHAAVGTLIMISIALVIAIPLGLLCAVFLAEFPSPFARVVRTVVEAMTALPSIVCGLFIYATYVLLLGFDKSAFAASLAITIMILPIVVRSADVVLRLVPATLKEASLATGASQWRTIWHVVLPTSRSGLMTAVVLGTARGIGETSPVLLTAGYTTFYNFNPFSGPMVSLPFATFTLVKSPEPTQVARGFGAAAVLMVLVFVLFLLARLMGGKGAGVQSPRGARRARAASARVLARIEQRELVSTLEEWELAAGQRPPAAGTGGTGTGAVAR
ncbi:phosphate ABC transporter permease PstA [Cellulomonas soli]|uniref:Phosphate transport system permease protein PstA n=1 Tax=Cellulomonas soli TaxID=931535 RepID=A0A512P9B3_9CELL|nr:phosphate ABC transporter permease PstA [Cellulomonas soli]NYI60283.1 phosphate transport system permease protein [Cellulomonas soli]GEP67794.1 phosphate transport system permease protein PstA [Cellulomonas soli]